MKPFVVAGVPRTGSSLLLFGLRQHPDVLAYSELLHPLEDERRANHAIERDGQRIALQEGDDPIRFLKAEVYGLHDQKAVGFKLLSLNGEYSRSERLYERMLREIDGLHFIHIMRPNYLDSLISWKLAHATGQWYRSNGASQAHQPVTISPAEAETYFRETEETDNWLSNNVRGRRYLQVRYDKLASDYPGQMAKVFRFLGVRDHPTITMLQKQSERSHQDVVTNFDELSEHFAGTAYGRFFRRPTVADRLFGALARFG